MGTTSDGIEFEGVEWRKKKSRQNATAGIMLCQA
jgi:hypothetical protein